jgi:predicted lipoprotein with Yx(FWY)xxD motif
MKKLIPILIVAGIAVGVVAVLPGSAHTTRTASASAKLQAHKGKLGRFVVDGRSMTLYLFEKDKTRASTCDGSCAQVWPPLTTSSKPVAGAGVAASKLGTTKRKDGKLQVTYNGHPLYYYYLDRKPGQTSGQGLKLFGAGWYVVAPSGKKIDDD